MNDINEYTTETTSLFYTKMTRADGTWAVCMMERNDEDDQLQLTGNKAEAQRNADDLAIMFPKVKYEVVEVSVA